MANQWFKFYGQDFLSDMKISQLSIAERMMWVTILCLASSEDKDGIIEFCNEKLLKSKMGLLESDQEWTDLEGVLGLFREMNMLEFTDNGIFIKNFGKRQESHFTPAEKMSRYRAKKNEVSDDTNTKVTKVTHNRIEKNRVDKKKEENTAEQDSAEIPLLIKEFESLNPAAKRFYGNKTQRAACKHLLETYGLERLKRVLSDTLPKTNGMPFFPNITTPQQLQDKWVALESAIRKYQSEKVKGKSTVAF